VLNPHGRLGRGSPFHSLDDEEHPVYKCLSLFTGLLLVLLSVAACASGDRVEDLLVLLGQRGVNIDSEIAELNRVVQLKERPDQARLLYADVQRRLEAQRVGMRDTSRVQPDNTLMARVAAGGVRIMAVTAHPDDENMMSGFLAFARDQGNSVFLLCLTSGEAGENPQSGDQRGEHLARRRAEELRGAAAVLGIQHEIAGFTNGAFKRKYPNQRLWLPGAALEAWREVRDPEQVVVDVATQLKPHIVLAIEPNWGWTGHPEHRAAAELARSAASRVGAEVAYAVMSAAEFTDQFDTSRWSGKRGMSYWTVKIAAARHHVSQYRLPTDAEKHPEQSPDLSVEHFRRGGTVESDK